LKRNWNPIDLQKKSKISERNERATIRSLITYLTRLISGYDTTIQQDEEYLKGNINQRYSLSLRLRMQEKSILHQAVDTLETIRDELFAEKMDSVKIQRPRKVIKVPVEEKNEL